MQITLGRRYTTWSADRLYYFHVIWL